MPHAIETLSEIALPAGQLEPRWRFFARYGIGLRAERR